MIILDKGHNYKLDSYDGDLDCNIRFMKRKGINYPGNKTENAGTNCQEVIRVLIDRVKYLQNQKFCTENDEILVYLREVLFLFEFRAAAFHDFDPPQIVGDIESMPTCKTCGHLQCDNSAHNNNELYK